MVRKLKIKSAEEKRIEANESDVANILFESMIDKMKITQLEEELGNAVMEIMIMKMGGN